MAGSYAPLTLMDPVADLNVFMGRPPRLSHASLVFSLLLLGSVLAWGYVAKVDVGITAPAVVRPYGEMVPVTFRTTGEVTHIGVVEGDHVRAGSVLARLDSRMATSQSADVANRLARTSEQLRAIQAALVLLQTDTSGRPAGVEMLPEPTHSYMAALVTSMSLARHDRDVAESAERVERALAARGFTTQVADQAAEDAVSRAALQLETIRANGERDLVAQATSLRDDVERLKVERSRAALSSEDEVLRAPVSGSVTGLSLQRSGQMAREGQTLLRILPDGANLVLDATIRPAERGRVSADQAVVIRFDAFDAQRFGVAHGRIAKISPDVQFSQSGVPIGYHVLIRFDAEQFAQGLPPGRQIQPGMTASVQMISDRERALTLILQQVHGDAKREGKQVSGPS